MVCTTWCWDRASSAAQRCAEVCPPINTSPTGRSLPLKTCSSGSNSRSITPDIEPSAAKCSRTYPFAKTATTSSSTTRCWRNAYILATASVKCRVRQSILRKRPRSILEEVCSTVLAWLRRPYALRWNAPDSRIAQSSVKMVKLSIPIPRLTTTAKCPPGPSAAEDALLTLPFPRQESQNLAGQVVREPETCLGPGIQVNGRLVQPDHRRLQRTVLGTRAVIGGTGSSMSVSFGRV